MIGLWSEDGHRTPHVDIHIYIYTLGHGWICWLHRFEIEDLAKYSRRRMYCLYSRKIKVKVIFAKNNHGSSSTLEQFLFLQKKYWWWDDGFAPTWNRTWNPSARKVEKPRFELSWRRGMYGVGYCFVRPSVIFVWISLSSSVWVWLGATFLNFA